jgi:hypothetical protein
VLVRVVWIEGHHYSTPSLLLLYSVLLLVEIVGIMVSGTLHGVVVSAGVLMAVDLLVVEWVSLESMLLLLHHPLMEGETVVVGMLSS